MIAIVGFVSCLMLIGFLVLGVCWMDQSIPKRIVRRRVRELMVTYHFDAVKHAPSPDADQLALHNDMLAKIAKALAVTK